MDSGLLHCLD